MITAVPRSSNRSTSRGPLLFACALLASTAVVAYPLPAALTYIAVGLAAIGAVLVRLRIHRVGAWAFANLAVWLLFGLAVGSLTPGFMATPEFLGGEGRAFLFYLPFIYYAAKSADRCDLEKLVTFTKWVVYVHVPLLFLGIGGRGGLFFGLMQSHVGAGTFWGIVSVMLASQPKRRRLDLVAPGLAFLFVLLTGARSAVVAVALAYLLEAVLSLRSRRLLRTFAVLGIAALLAPLVAPTATQRFLDVLAPDKALSILAVGPDASGLQSETAAEQNARIRVSLWKSDVQAALESPLIGTGFARYNDLQRSYSGLPGIVLVATDGERVATEKLEIASGELEVRGNAHNAYIQYLVEVGVLGLLLLLAFWYSLFTTLGSARGFEDWWYFRGCRLAVFVILFAALFGNALATPTAGAPVAAFAGLGIAVLNGQQRARQADAEQLPVV